MIVTVYGKPKVGKTTFALSAEGAPPLILDSDHGLLGTSCDGADVASVESVDDLQKVLSDRKRLAKAGSIVVDTATALYPALLRSAAGNKPPSLPLRGQINDLFGDMLASLRSTGKPVIVTAQEKLVTPYAGWEPSDEDEEAMAYLAPDLPPGAAKALMIMSDAIGRMYTVTVDGKLRRRLHLAPSASCVSGARSSVYKGSPAFLSAPTLPRLVQKLGW